MSLATPCYAGIYLHNGVVDEDQIFKALADPSRRRLLDMLHEQPAMTLGDLCAGLDMRRQSVSQHLDVLEAAGLVTSTREGRRKLHYLNPVPIREIHDRWISRYAEPFVTGLLALRDQVEADGRTGA